MPLRLFFIPLLLICLFVAPGCDGGPAPIVVEPVAWETADGPVRGWVAVVRLDDPRVEVVVTAPLDDAVAASWPGPGKAEAELIPTDQWARSVSADLAVNANYFGWLDAPGQTRGTTGLADIVGLSISDGVVVSPARVYAGVADHALAIDRQGRARIGSVVETDRVVDAVAGVGGSESAPEPVTRLVTRGVNTGQTSRVAPDHRHPRTAVGVDRSGHRLLLLVIDGRQPGWSVGVTLPELADFMIERGAHEAINLDGGGSASFVYRYTDDAGHPQALTNRPSQGDFRPVANHLGIRVHACPASNPTRNRRLQP